MDVTLEQLTAFLGWCSAIHVGMIAFTAVWIRVAPDATRRSQRWIFASLTDEQIDVAIYGYMAVYKAIFVIFNLVPYLVLRLVVLPG